MRVMVCYGAAVMSSGREYVSWSELKLIEDDDLDEILQLADNIRANPVYDDTDLTSFNSQSSALAQLAAGNLR